MTTELTKQDQCDYRMLKSIIRKNKDAVLEVAKALKDIRNRQLWQKEYESYADFCKGEFGFSLSKANKLIAQELGSTVSLEPVSLRLSESAPDDTVNADSAPDEPETDIIDTETGEVLNTPPWVPPSKRTPAEPVVSVGKEVEFKKLEAALGHLIRCIDQCGKDGQHSAMYKLYGDMYIAFKKWEPK